MREHGAKGRGNGATGVTAELTLAALTAMAAAATADAHSPGPTADAEVVLGGIGAAAPAVLGGLLQQVVQLAHLRVQRARRQLSCIISAACVEHGSHTHHGVGGSLLSLWSCHGIAVVGGPPLGWRRGIEPAVEVAAAAILDVAVVDGDGACVCVGSAGLVQGDAVALEQRAVVADLLDEVPALVLPCRLRLGGLDLELVHAIVHLTEAVRLRYLPIVALHHHAVIHSPTSSVQRRRRYGPRALGKVHAARHWRGVHVLVLVGTAIEAGSVGNARHELGGVRLPVPRVHAQRARAAVDLLLVLVRAERAIRAVPGRLNSWHCVRSRRARLARSLEARHRRGRRGAALVPLLGPVAELVKQLSRDEFLRAVTAPAVVRLLRRASAPEVL
mmetsp:Transcript_72314/g.190662  ORF Transcript_72314/g.190662 Transcript_72314/m.190662 type:complete len:388 (-) Transcript_72314:233-1396(-)